MTIHVEKADQITATNLRNLPAAVPGFTDYSPEEQILFDLWKNALSETYRLNGFNPLDVSPVVRKDFLIEKGGINHEIFGLTRLNGELETKMGLAFDRTVPLALWVRDRISEINFPYKRFDIDLSYRGESPSPGRFCGFYQCDVDICGRDLSLTNDVQCISAGIQGLNKILEISMNNLEDREFVMYLNDINIPKALFQQANVPEEKVPEGLRIVDKMDKIGQEEVFDQLSTLLEDDVSLDVIQNMVEVFSYKGPLNEFEIPNYFPEKAKEGLQNLEQVISELEDSHEVMQKLHFCPGMVRGLDYYTGVVFETFLTKLPKAGSVMSGGRYAELLNCFTKNHKGEIKKTGIEGTGCSTGLTRLFDVLQNAKMITPTQKTACKVMVLSRGLIKKIPEQIARALRGQKIECDVYSGNSKKITTQLSYANKLGVPIAVMVMEDKVYCVKHLKVKDNQEKPIQSEDLQDIEDVVKTVNEFLKLT